MPAPHPLRHGPYPELTLTAVIVGYLLGAVITVSIGYASLILGFSTEGSELAAILGWGVLRGVLRRTSIVENNINQTIASAVNGASAGMMFSVPALFILDQRYPGVSGFSPLLMILACIAGGVLGLTFIIPLRKQMIDFDRLAFPGGIAVAAILKSPGAGLRKAMLLLGGAIVSGVAHVLVVKVLPTALPSLGLEHDSLPLGALLDLPGFLNISFYLSLLTVAAGFLSGRGGLWFGAGGFLCYWVLAPLLAWAGSEAVQQLTAQGPAPLRDLLFRPVGIGMLIGAAIGGIFSAYPLIRSAIKAMRDAAREGEGVAHDELPLLVLYAGIAAGTIALIVIAYVATPGISLMRAGAMALLGVLWVWIAGVIISECLGRTNWSPLSGMTLIAVTILILISSGLGDRAAIVGSVLVGAAICVAIAQAGDMMLDLKSGYLVGATPRLQQLAQYLGTWLGPILVMGLIYVLHAAYGLGSKRLPAPQATALAAMIEGILGGNIPAFRYAAGAGLGLVLAAGGRSGIGVLIGLGFYMPFDIVLTYTIGSFARIALDHFKGRRFSDEVGVPVAAGLIVGEALVGVTFAVGAVLQGAAGGGG